MTLLIIGLVVFFAIHFVPILAGFRGKLVAAWGEPIYKTTFSVISAIGFVMILLGKGKAGFAPVWTPPEWGAPLAKILMAPAFILLLAAYIPCNLKRWVGHPMLIAILLWACAHLLTNGDLASILLFGSFGLYSLVDLYSCYMRASAGEQLSRRWTNDAAVVLAGALIYLFVYHIHSAVFAPLP